jgi:hypothetical protein
LIHYIYVRPLAALQITGAQPPGTKVQGARRAPQGRSGRECARCGQPRQKHIKFLGSVRLDGRDRQRFWYDVTTTLNRLGNRVSPDDRKQIEAAIVKRVGGKPMTKAQLRQFDQNREGLLAILARAFPGRAR